MRNSICIFLFLWSAISVIGGTPVSGEELNRLLQNADSEQERIDILLRTANECRELEPQRSLDHSRSALEQSRYIGYTEGEIRGLILMGELYNFLGSFDVALQYHLDAVTLSEDYGFMTLLARAYNAIGGVYYNQEDYTRAFPYFSRALNIRRKYGTDSLVAGSLNNVGEVFRLQNELDRALEYYNEAYEINKRLNNSHWMAINLNNLGLVYWKQGKHDMAKKYLNQSLDICEKANNIIGMAMVHSSLGEIYFEENNIEKTLFHLNIAYDYARESKYAKAIRDVSGSLSIVYESIGEFQEALKYQKIFERIKDSMLNEDRLKRQMLVREHFESEQKEEEIEQLRHDKKLNSMEVDRQRRENYFLLGSGFLLVMLLAFAIHQNRQKKKNNKLLVETVAQKEVLLKEIHHRVKNNLQLVSSLLSLQAGKINDPNALQAVQDSHSRVRSMAILHQELYMRKLSGKIDLQKYLERLMESARDSFDTMDSSIQTEIHADTIDLDVDQSIPMGLIVNELVTNAFKYAFKDREEGVIQCELRSLPGKAMILISDNGVGMPEDIDIKETDSLGLEIVMALTGQLEGEFNYTSEPGKGTIFTITFPLKA